MNKMGHSDEVRLLTDLKSIVTAAREYAYRSANLAQVVSNWQIGQIPSAQSATPLYSNVCWSHYERLMRIDDPIARRWYLDETHREQWAVKTLRRNINSQYYYRLMQTPSSKRTEVVNEMHALTQNYQARKLEFLKNPVIVEFLGFQPGTTYSETKLEKAILDHIQEMVMELGKGYAFVARQQHVKTDMGDYYIDLVFYNYVLKFFLLIDLKMDQPTHQDVGQMDMYRRMYDKLKCTVGDNPTIGLLLCTETSKDLAQYSILHDNSNVFAAKFLTALPSKEELLKEIEEQKEIFKLQLEEKYDQL